MRDHVFTDKGDTDMTDALRFVLVPPEDDGVDPSYDLYDGDVLTNFSVQDASAYRAGYVVNQYGPSREKLEWVEHHGNFTKLIPAQQLARSLYQSSREVVS